MNSWLDRHVFSHIVKMSTHPLHIAGLILLWAALIFFGTNTSFALIGGNYFNGLCGIVSCVLLSRQATEVEKTKQHASILKSLHTKIETLEQAATADLKLEISKIHPPKP